MPSLAKRPCPVCGVLGSGGRCAAHQRKTDGHTAKTAARGYDAHHKDLRVLCFIRDEWRCVDCGWEPEIVSDFRLAGLPAPTPQIVLRHLSAAYARGERHLHADHQVPIEQREDLRLDLDNYQTLCNYCHSRKTANEDGGFGRHFGGAKYPQKAIETREFLNENVHGLELSGAL